MAGQGAEATQGVEVFGGGIAFVTVKAIVWMGGGKGEQLRVARGFRQNGGGGDGGVGGVALDDGARWPGQGGA